MPYTSKKTGKNQITVYKKDSGEVVGHTTPDKYNDYMAALHMHEPKGMAEGGEVSDEAKSLADLAASGAEVGADPEAIEAALSSRFEPSADAKDLADLAAAAGEPLAADPRMIDAGLKSMPETGKPVSQQISNALKSGPLGMPGFLIGSIMGDLTNPDTSYAPGAPMARGKTGKGYAEGGVVTAQEEAAMGEEPDEKKDPSEIPEEVRDFIDKAHKDQRESRPDEAWRIAPAKKPDFIAPYKRDEEEVAAEPDTLEQLRSMTAGYAKGGQIPGYDDGGMAPQPMSTTDLPAPAPFLDPNTLQDLPAGSPMPPPEAPAPATPNVPRGTMPPPTDQDFMTQANKMLGLNPDQQAGFMKLLGQNQQKAQIGAGIAGIGDAIASGGTLGKVNPGALNKSEELINNRTNQGLEGMQTIRGNQEKALEVADKLEARDPNSPLSKYAQKAYAGVGKKIGLDLSHASASLIGDVSGKGVDALNTEYQNQLKTMGLQLQKAQVDATIANQKAERQEADTARSADAAKTLAGQTLFRKGVNQLTPSGRAAQTLLQNQASGVKSFNSVQEAEAAGLPVGTRVSIGGRMATIK